MERLLAGLGDPHVGLRLVHVAGTNGKGSTIAFVDSILRAQGVKTGRTTSPHLTCARERIAIGGAPVDEETFVGLERRVARVVRRMGDDPPTFFERIIAMALCAFAEAEVDVGLMEVGLGGRLDATNVITPVVTGVTKIGIDHTKWLGSDLAGIAREKAGIFKRGVPAWTVPQAPAARDALRAAAEERGVALRVAKPAKGRIGLEGGHQRQNAGLALALAGAAWPLSDPKIARGLAAASWPGRLERVLGAPRLWLDGAHNLAGVEALELALRARADGPRALVVGFTQGHDEVGLGRAVRALACGGPVFAVQARAPRSLPAERVAEVTGGEALGVEEALERALGFAAQRDRAAVVTGSLYLVGEVRARFVEMPLDPALPMF
jgi:dihydrofolate synthase/folylpolyglutamate synthase